MIKLPKKLNKKVFKNIFDGILAKGQADILSEFPELRKSFIGITKTEPEDYYLDVTHKFEVVIRDIISKELNKDVWGKETSAILFLFLNYKYIENNILSFIYIKEGSTCSVDKSRWLIKSLFNYYATNTPIDMTIDDKCYWKPGFWTADQWIELFNVLISFHYGDFNRYMFFLKKHWLPELQSKGGQYEVHKNL